MQDPPSQRHRLAAPTNDGGILQDPPLTRAGDLARQNAARLSKVETPIAGRPLREFRRWTQQILRGLSGLEPATDDQELWFVTGHQPGLFHPGVWVKNWATCELSHQHHGLGWNWIVDNDLLSTRTVTVPQRSPNHPPLGPIAWDAPALAMPWDRN